MISLVEKPEDKASGKKRYNFFWINSLALSSKQG
jgi:hypothetical protein